MCNVSDADDASLGLFAAGLLAVRERGFVDRFLVSAEVLSSCFESRDEREREREREREDCEKKEIIKMK